MVGKIDDKYGSRTVELGVEFILRKDEKIEVKNTGMGLKLIKLESQFRDETGDHSTATISLSIDKKEEKIELCIDQQPVEGNYNIYNCSPSTGCVFKKDRSLFSGRSYSSPVSKASFKGYSIELTGADSTDVKLRVEKEKKK